MEQTCTPTHIAPPAKYKKRPPEVWAAVRAGWEAGVAPKVLAGRYDVGVHAIRWRAREEGWTRRVALAAASAGETRAAREPEFWPGGAPPEPLKIAETALGQALTALAQGRASDVLSLIKAADALGEFADFVRRKRAEAAAIEAAEADGSAPDAEG